MTNHHSAADPKLAAAAREGCAESRLLLSRRALMGISAGLFSSAFLPNFALGATNPNARFLLVILRGGMDGMGMLIPTLDPLYPTVRRELALAPSATLSLGSDFALHPALAKTQAMFLAGDAAFVPAAGIPLRNRSHFECQDNLENGLPANTPDATGWLNRMLGALPVGDPIRVSHGIEIGDTPLVLRGPEPVLGWSPTWFEKSTADNISRLQNCYRYVDPELRQMLARGLAADKLALSSGAGDGNVSDLRKSFIGAGRLMAAPNGPRVAVLSIDGWDMHTQEGGTTGPLNDILVELDQALDDFKSAVGTLWADTVGICCTEFGRTVITNGDSGTDHGIGTVAVMMGGAVKQGFVGDWPGLATNQLEDGDLRVTVDLRGVFKGILRDHIGMPASVLESTVFPGSSAVPPISGLVKTPAAVSAPLEAFQRPPSIADVAPIARYRQQYGLDSAG